jgi:hypothetical protein
MKSDMGFPAEECAQNGRRNRQYDIFHKESLVWICRNFRGSKHSVAQLPPYGRARRPAGHARQRGGVVGISSTERAHAGGGKQKPAFSKEERGFFVFMRVAGTGIEWSYEKIG